MPIARSSRCWMKLLHASPLLLALSVLLSPAAASDWRTFDAWSGASAGAQLLLLDTPSPLHSVAPTVLLIAPCHAGDARRDHWSTKISSWAYRVAYLHVDDADVRCHQGVAVDSVDPTIPRRMHCVRPRGSPALQSRSSVLPRSSSHRYASAYTATKVMIPAPIPSNWNGLLKSVVTA